MTNLYLKSINTVNGFLKSLCIYQEVIAEAITQASYGNTYVETVNPHISDSLHYNLDKNYSETITIEFFRFTKKLIRKERFGCVDLIADITEEDFYGKSCGFYLHGWTGEKGVKAKIRYLVAAIKYRNKIIPFYVSILPLGAFKADYLGKAVEYCNSLGIKINSILLDRGFYSGDIINAFENTGTKYLIFTPKNKFIKTILNGSNENCIIEHEIKYTCNKTKCKARCNQVFIRDYENYDWVFATNFILKDMTKYISLYKKRWNIETMFRVHDEARIKSKSIKPEIRLFYFAVSMLILLIWNLYHKEKITFKKFVYLLFEEMKLAIQKISC